MIYWNVDNYALTQATLFVLLIESHSWRCVLYTTLCDKSLSVVFSGYLTFLHKLRTCVSTYSIKMIKKIEEDSCRDIAVNCSKVKWFSLAGKKCFLLKMNKVYMINIQHILSAFVTIQSKYVPGRELSKAKKN